VLEDHPLRFQPFHEQIANPFVWKFTREDLKKMLEKVSQRVGSLLLPDPSRIRHRTYEAEYLGVNGYNSIAYGHPQ